MKFMIVSKRLFKLADSEWASPVFRKYGRFVAEYPKSLILGSVILSLLLSIGSLRINVQDDLRFMYTPPRSPSFDEYRIHMDFQSPHNLSFAYVYVAVVTPDHGGNVLRRNIATVILNVNEYIFNNLTISDEKIHFGHELCPKLPLCPDSNKGVAAFLQAYFDPDDGYARNMTNLTSDDEQRNKYTYPVSKIYGVDAFLASNFYDIHTDTNGEITKIGLVHLTYFYPIKIDTDQKAILEFERALNSYLDSVESEYSNEIQLLVFSMNKLQTEVAMNTFRVLPYLPFSVIVLVAYTVWSTTVYSDPIKSKPLEGLMGVCTTLLAVISSYGLMFAFGVPYNSTVAVVPFLTLALAVDDTYIILAAWRQIRGGLRSDQRLGLTLSSAGCAITVAMLTDVFAFVVGVFSNTPAIEHFCLFIATAVAFDYLYQLTFFSAFLGLSGRRESSGKHCIFFWLPAEKVPCWPKQAIDNEKSPCKSGCIEKFIKTQYARVLTNGQFRILAFLAYIAYVCISFWGCMKLTVNLTPSKLLARGSDLDRYTNLVENHIWKEGLIGLIYVRNAPDLGSPVERDRFDRFVRSLENTVYSMGSQSTTLWLNDYMAFLQYLQVDINDPPVFYRHLNSFLNLNDNERWNRYLHLTNRSSIISVSNASIFKNQYRTLNVDSFFFTTGFHLDGWPKLLGLIQTWRRICRNYSDYHAVVYEDNNFYADQIASLAPNVIQDTGIAFFCMILAGALFIPNLLMLFWVTWSLFSMNLGVIGLLALWGCDLDPTAVTSILLSIGLTVDFTVHVAYHYFKNSSKSARKMHDEKAGRRKILEDTLAVAGWPLIQGGLSTTLAVVALIFVPSYVVGVFLRTVLLVVALGLLHALIYLPIFLISVTLDAPRRRSNYRIDQSIDRKSIRMH